MAPDQQHLPVLCACPWVAHGPDGEILCLFTRAVADLMKQSDLVREETGRLRDDVRSVFGRRDAPLTQLPDRANSGCSYIGAKTGTTNAR